MHQRDVKKRDVAEERRRCCIGAAPIVAPLNKRPHRFGGDDRVDEQLVKSQIQCQLSQYHWVGPVNVKGVEVAEKL